VLGRDLLSPLLTAALLPDLVQRVIPFRVGPFDRARALEGALESAWKSAMDTRAFNRPFLDLWAADAQRVPSLLMNSTEVESGERVVTTNLALPRAMFPHMHSSLDLDPGFDPPLSTAAFLSARFPYITPAGWIRAPEQKDMPSKRRLVDGGYFENTGIATILDVIEVLRSVRGSGGSVPEFRVIVIRIGAHDGTNIIQRQGMGESLSPIRAMLNTRGARGRDAIEQIRREMLRGRDAGNSGLIEYVLETHGAYPIPLGWLLSEAARDQIKGQLDEQFQRPGSRPVAPRAMHIPGAPAARRENIEARRAVRDLIRKSR
jgi:hypothetical protein